ncbi:microtubule-associated tumor suppressor candidate 2 [Puntigrus tetrazona]|uniref:microtubule-associated tumor suppressor candidate 2 n=1 Tax=Puntigrus tetrazona TaxID=1606681 RepID=UPI001C899DC0|nr:microtubule-associated tumor suppressor candidate 2 [Puntigrus tetrazona]XP_043114344.1 microtubule-associated tumor suppressor candidate 2 [Puntigrus tetrazona]
MSVNEEHNTPFGTSIEDDCKEIRNNNRHAEDSLDGDANANEMQRGNGGTTLKATETLSSVVSHTEQQVKMIIQGTDSPCDDPELAEFERLESQEIEDDEESIIPRGDVKCDTNLMQTEAMSPKDGKRFSQFISKEQESYPQFTSKEMVTSITRTEFSSENDVFVSCLSTMSSLGGSLASALNHAGQTQSSDSWHAPSGPYRTLSEDLTLASQSCLTISDKSRSSVYTDGIHHQAGKSTMHIGSVDLNLNSTTLPEETLLEAQENQPATDFLRYESSGQLTNGMSECSIARIKKVPNESGSTSQDNLGESETQVKKYHGTEDKAPNLKTVSTEISTLVSDNTQFASCNRRFSHDSAGNNKLKYQEEESHKTALKTSKLTSKDIPVQSGGSEPQPYKKQASFEKTRSSSASSLERRRPWGSPSRPETPPPPKTTCSPWKQPPSSPAKAISTREASQERNETLQRGTTGLRQPSKSFLSSSSSLSKPAVSQQPTREEFESKKFSPPQKPKNVRPKIITYVRKSPQAKPMSEGPYEVSTLPPRLTPYSSSLTSKEKAEGSRGSPVLSSSNILYDKYRQEVQRSGYYSPPGLMASGIRPPSHTVPHKLVGKSESFHGELPDQYLQGGKALQLNTHDAAAVFRFPRALKPQLGLGAVTRQPAAKNRTVLPGQRSASPLSYTAPAVQAPSSHQEPAVDQKRLALGVSPKFMLPKPGQSGLRPPGFSHLPPARLATFGFVRSASVSSVSSNQSNDSIHSDPCRSSRPHSSSDETLLTRSPLPPAEGSAGRSHNRSSPRPQPADLCTHPRASPVVSRKELQRDVEITRPIVSSPKRFAVVSPKPQSPVRQKSCVARLGGRAEGVDAERERLMIQRLKERCEDQARQLITLQDELRKSSRCLDVFTITTQHFCQKSENATVKERELSLQLVRIRDEVVVSVQRWERLQGEKAQLEQSFERELKGLQEEQQQELKTLKERLVEEHTSERQRLQQQQNSQLEQLQSQHLEQIEEMSENHERAMIEMEATHGATLATLQEEHTRTIKNLKMAHEQQKKSMEEEFEKLRLSLQDQVDTLTFQNRSLRDRAKRFEEALRRSTDEQIVDALAPYQHIEEDLKSLKEVLEMKNQQIHQQELKISELEKMAQKNVLLEERIQVLQQQNEDLKDRIDRNLATSRQLSEENANLQVYVEKESNEKKRLSRTNEELLWRLQTGELSPRMSPTQSPLHRPVSSPSSPSRQQPFPR